jgi:hypothetical protein
VISWSRSFRHDCTPDPAQSGRSRYLRSQGSFNRLAMSDLLADRRLSIRLPARHSGPACGAGPLRRMASPGLYPPWPRTDVSALHPTILAEAHAFFTVAQRHLEAKTGNIHRRLGVQHTLGQRAVGIKRNRMPSRTSHSQVSGGALRSAQAAPAAITPTKPSNACRMGSSRVVRIEPPALMKNSRKAARARMGPRSMT